MSDVYVSPGQPLIMRWALPFDEPYSDTPTLDLGADELRFAAGSYNRVTDPTEFFLLHDGEGWALMLNTTDLSLLQPGANPWSLTVLTGAGNILLNESGTVFLNG